MKFEKPELPRAEKEKNIEQVDLRELVNGDRVSIETTGGNDKTIYKITLIGREKGRPLVNVKDEWFHSGNLEKSEEFIARWVAGDFDMKSYSNNAGRGLSKEEKEDLRNLIKVGDKLLFENVKDKDGNTRERAMVSEVISGILEVIKKETK
ncbi:MAG: hypothetical protein G01um10143_749 [Parcubacteria group bacterium Gr01-1014_3]|nr:MAG: hypothetical protein G01um10143_749 [Parcubacteria group bacterium Gr01-1014_3]